MLRKTGCSSNRGSALLMIVGLLTILALLGGTFLIVARYERKQAQALESSPEPDARAQEIFDTIRAKLVEDLYISGTSGPYSSQEASNNPSTWRRFIDCPPSTDMDSSATPTLGYMRTNLYDFWLASFEPNSSDVWPQISCVVANVPDPLVYIDENASSLFDTDGNTVGDSQVTDIDLSLLNGNRYSIAARVIDLSGLLALNTVGETSSTTTWTTICPTSVNILGLQSTSGGVTSTINTNILSRITDGNGSNQGRNGTNTSATLESYYENCGYKLAGPASNYNPFSAADELFLRWLSTDNPSKTGRIYNATSDLTSDFGPSFRKYLTATSTSRSIVRHPSSFTINNGNRVPLVYTNSSGINLSNPTVREQLYTQLCEAIPNNATPANRRKIAQFVVNLWAYTATSAEIRASDFSWTPSTPSVGTVYAAVPQLVISDVFAVHISPTEIAAPPALPPFWDAAYGYAYGVELLNPTNVAIDPAEYTITSNGVSAALTSVIGTGTIEAGHSVVIYKFSGKAVDKSKDISTLFATPDATWHSWNNLDFNHNNNPFSLTETRGSTTFPIDSVTPSDFGWSASLDYAANTAAEEPSNAIRANRTFCAGCYRDDSVTDLGTTPATIGRDRALVGGSGESGYYRPTALSGDSTTDTAITNFVHPLGRSNFTDEADATGKISLGTCAKGFYFDFDSDNYSPTSTPKHAINNFADIANLYLVGPTPTQSLPMALNSYATDSSRGRIDFTTDAAYYASSTTSYPDVPWPTLLNELTEVLDTDPTATVSSFAKIYGRININTAPKEVLMQLPFTYIDVDGNGVQDSGEEITDATREAIVNAIINYRDDSSSRTGATNLRTNSQYRGFLTPGEIAIPLRTYTTSVIGTPDSTASLKAVNSLYKAVANVVSVNSDTYAAYITVILKKPLGSSETLNQWRYLAIFDRSNCTSNTDTPDALLGLTRIK
ncbi:MAG TPA: hypothetical protein PLK08_01950 [Phycisphaerae bacterium]|nr:hypothetical protein [Phycisphaerae bacterium]